MNEVILVDKDDNEIGRMEKLEAHRKGLLHRAFSILIVNSNGDLLLQKRAQHKYHSGGLWTNACCSHPAPGEAILVAAKNRLQLEMGMMVDNLVVSGKFIYHAPFDNGLIEHELDYIITGISDEDPILNPEEAEKYRWISKADLIRDIQLNAEQYTFWFKEIIQKNMF